MRFLRKLLAFSPVVLVSALASSQDSARLELLPTFVDVAQEAGVTLMNRAGDGSGDYIVGASGNGAAFFDYDRDGDVDLLIANGSTLDDYREGGTPMVALYENTGDDFADVTAGSGLERNGWGMGVCVADYDNDGYSDVYLTALGPNILFRNLGNGVFREAAGAGVANPNWGTSCAFGDYDRDGDVDLYVSNYLTFDETRVPRRGCRFRSANVFCGPFGLPGEPDVLYRNDGDGRFTNATRLAGITDSGRYGFGVLWSDFDNDGWPDLYVANDSVPNFLFRNDRDGTFSEAGLVSGTSVNLLGSSQAGMGLAVADYDGNGLLDIFVTNFAQDTNTLYQNRGELFFTDATSQSGAATASRRHVGWGAGFADLDNDGWRDLFVANGHVYPDIDTLGFGSRYLEPKEVYRNLGDGSFEEITAKLGADLTTPRSARGAAFADYDNDGDIDILVINSNARPNLYRNEGGNRVHWIGLRLEGVESNRDAIGARVEIEAGGRTRVAEVQSGGSYLSHNDMRIHFGLGASSFVDRVRVLWPDGSVEEFESIRADRFLSILEGQGLTGRSDIPTRPRVDRR